MHETGVSRIASVKIEKPELGQIYLKMLDSLAPKLGAWGTQVSTNLRTR